MIIKNSFNLDFAHRGIIPRMDAVQNDANSRIVEINLLDNGVAWTVPENAKAAVFYSKPDGTVGIYDVLPDGSDACAISGSTVTVVLAPQMLTAPGLVRASVALTRESVQLATFPLGIQVEAMPGAEAVPSESYYYHTTFAELNSAIGDLALLGTLDKSSLVAAFNELLARGGTGTVRSVNGTGPDEAGNVTLEMPKGFSGSWYDLKDKPFGETRIFYKWSETAEFPESVAMDPGCPFARLDKISSDCPDPAFFVGKSCLIDYEDQAANVSTSRDITAQDISQEGLSGAYCVACIRPAPDVCVSLLVCTDEFTSYMGKTLTRGIWAMGGMDKSVFGIRPIAIGIAGFTTIQEAFIPDTIPRITDVQNMINAALGVVENGTY